MFKPQLHGKGFRCNVHGACMQCFQYLAFALLLYSIHVLVQRQELLSVVALLQALCPFPACPLDAVAV